MNRIKSASRLSSLALILASSIAAVAQTSESGQFSGKIMSADGKPIANATVLVRSEKLIGDRVVKTDANGQYRIPLLPPGEYILTVTAANYRTQKTSTPIRLGLGAQMHEDFLLKPMAETAGAVVEVLANTAIADKADSKVSTNFSSEIMSTLPATNRGFEGGIDLSPGVTTGAGGQFGTAVIRGGKSQTAVYTLNGTSVGDDISGMSPSGQANVFFVEDAIEDTQVVLSPLNARYGRTGSGVINMATITGGNEFSGSIRKYISRNDWTAFSPGQQGNGSQLADQYANRNTDIVFSGPIWKDHIWFTTSTVLAPTTGAPISLSDGTNPANWKMVKDPTAAAYGYTWAPGTKPTNALATGQLYGYDYDKGVVDNSQQKSTFWQFKLTYAVNQDHTLSYEKSHYDNQTKDAGFNGGSTMVSIGSYKFPEGPKNWYEAYSYKGTLTSNLFAEAIYSDKHWTHTNGPLVPFPHVREYLTGPTGAGGGMIWPYGTNANTSSIEDNANKNVAINFKLLANLAGSHEIDLGYQYYESRHNTAGIAGPDLQRFYVYGSTVDPSLLQAAGVTGKDPFGNVVGFLAANYIGKSPTSPNVAPGYRKYFGQDGIHANRDGGYYINDSYAPNEHWNIMAGLRIEKVRDTDTNGAVLVDFWSSLSPRVAIKYDPKGDSSNVFSASIARFTEDITAGTSAQWVTSPGNAYVNYGFHGLADNKTVTWVDFATLTNPNNYLYPAGSPNSTAFSEVDNSAGVVGLNKLRSPYIMEYSVGYRRNHQNGSFFAINYVQKEWYRDVAQAFNAYDPATYNSVQLDTNLPAVQTLANRVLNSPDIRRSYRGVEISFEEHFTSRVTYGGSYTWSRLTGNDNGGDSFQYPYKTNGVSQSAVTWANEYYTFRDALLANGWQNSQFSPYGMLLADAPQKARLYLTYNMPLGTKGGKISYSLLARYDSGYNWSAVSGDNASSGDLSPWVNIDPPTGANVPSQVANATFTYYSSGRGAFHQNDNHSVDFRLDFLTPLGLWKVKLMGNVVITNIFNTTLLTNYEHAFSGADQSVTPTNILPYTVANPATYGSGLSGVGVANPYAYNTGRSVSASMGFKF